MHASLYSTVVKFDTMEHYTMEYHTMFLPSDLVSVCAFVLFVRKNVCKLDFSSVTIVFQQILGMAYLFFTNPSIYNHVLDTTSLYAYTMMQYFNVDALLPDSIEVSI